MNPDDWPNVDFKPSRGSLKGQRYVGPGGEKIDNLGELTANFRTERHGGGDISSRMTCLTKVTLWFSKEVDPSYCQTRMQVWHLREKQSQEFKDVFHCMRKMESSSCGRGNLRTGR